MSLGCGYWVDEDTESDFAAERPWFARGYVAITYRDHTRNPDPQRLVDLANALLSQVPGSEEHFINFAFDIVPLRGFFDAQERFYELVMNVAGRGRSSTDARRAFDYATLALAKAVAAKHGRVDTAIA
jgi:hypothetical protein